MADTTSHKPDILLRSPDGKTFPTWKVFLAFSSPIFNDMFRMPKGDSDTSQSVDEIVDGLPVVDLQEDSHTLALLLTLCQPLSCTGRLFEVKTIQELGAILDATTKYDMEGPRRVALGKLTDSSLLQADPLRVYALACQYECAEAAQLAAKHTLGQPLWKGGYIPELEKIHAGNLYRLLLYREKCGAAASSLTTDHTWITYEDVPSLFGCNSDWSTEGGKREDMESTTVRHHPSKRYKSGRLENVSVHKWWIDYMNKSGYALERTPCGSTVKEAKLVGDTMSAMKALKCKGCEASDVAGEFRSFVTSFADMIEQTIEEVTLDLGF